MYLKYLNTIFFANDIILWKCLCENTIFSKPFDSTARNLLLSECHANRSCFLLARLIYSYLISKKQKKKTKKKTKVKFSYSLWDRVLLRVSKGSILQNLLWK